MKPLPRIVSVDHIADYRLSLTFADGLSGEVDLRDHLWGPVFEPLRDPDVFRQVHVDPELGTVVWPNGADIDPCALHEKIASSVQARSTG